MRKGYIVDVLTSVDIQENVKTVGKVIENYNGVNSRENFKESPFKKVIDKLFEIRQKYKDEINDVMQLLVRLIMISLHRGQIRKVIEGCYQCESEKWMLTEYDERFFDYQKISYSNSFLKLKDDVGLQDEVKKVITIPLQLGVFVLSKSKMK